MNTTTAQVPGQRSKTFGDRLKAALPYLGAAAAIGGAVYGYNQYDQSHKFKPLSTLPNNPIDSRRRPSDDDGPAYNSRDNIGFEQGLFGEQIPFRPADPNAFGYDPSTVNTENYKANLRFYNEQKAREKPLPTIPASR
jgi:hypothetical protein